MIYIGWGVEIYLSACLIGKCFFHLGKRLFGLHGIFGNTTKLLKFSSFYLNFICSCLLLRCYSIFSYLLLKHPVCIRCILTYLHWGKKISVPEDWQCGIQFLLYIHAVAG